MSVQGVCLTGWHLPSDGEWKELEMQLGMSQADADLMSTIRGTNEGSRLAGNAILWVDGALEVSSKFGTSGFEAFPGGYRYGNNGVFNGIGYYGNWWSSTEYSSTYVWKRTLGYYYSYVYRNYYGKSYGFSVRCVRN